MGILSGNPKDEPMHYGEIFSVWTFASAAKACLTVNQTLLNHVGDKDLKQHMLDFSKEAEQEIKECETLLKDNGISPAPGYAEKPKANWEDIPAGARFTDPEISMMVTADMQVGLVSCSQIIAQSIREDIGALFAKYHATKTANLARMLRLNKEKAWLIPPPLQIKTPELAGAR